MTLPKNPLSTTWIRQHYQVTEPITIELLRAYTNDVYLVTTGCNQAVLKVYGAGWRTWSEVCYEIEWIQHLVRRGVQVATPIAAYNGHLVQEIDHGGTPRLVVLFSYASGEKPRPPFSVDLYRKEGQAVAALHAVSDDFISTHTRPQLDSNYLLERPWSVITQHMPSATIRSFFATYVQQLHHGIVEVADQLDSGPCHGDVTMDNFHLTDDGTIVWYDFDSGGPGWRAMDLQGWAALVPEAKPRWDAFLRGYQEVRPLDPINIEAAPLLAAATEVWGMAVDLQTRELAKGPEAVQQYMERTYERCRAWENHLGLALY